MAEKAAVNLFREGIAKPAEVQALILCTQTPDYALPGTSSLLHDRLHLSPRYLAFDFNQGCTGLIYGLFVAGTIIHFGQIDNALVIFSEAYSKWCHPMEKSVTTIFGDGAAAVFLTRSEHGSGIGPFVRGTDKTDFSNLTVPVSGSHLLGRPTTSYKDTRYNSGNIRTATNLFMNSPELIRFAIDTVPDLVTDLLNKAGVTMQNIDKFVFHQANKFMLRQLREIIGVAEDKMIYEMEETGNTDG